MLSKIADKIIMKLIESDIISSEDKEVYIYGITCLMLKIMHITFYFTLGVLTSAVTELIIFLMCYIPLRTNAGGYHADTSSRCFVISGVLVYGAIQIAFLLFYLNHKELIVIIAALSTSINLLLCPVGTENKQHSQEDKTYYKNKVLLIYIAEAIVFLILYNAGFLQLAYTIITAWMSLSIMLVLGLIKNTNGRLYNNVYKEI